MASARSRMNQASDQPADTVQEQPQEEPTGLNREIDQLRQGADLAATYIKGRSFGLAPKAAAAVGAVPIKLALEGRELVDSGYKAPSYSDIYKKNVELYNAPSDRAYKEHPVLATIAELAGGLKTGGDIAATKAGRTVANSARTGLLPQATSLAGRAANLGTKAAIGSATGATSGAIYGAGTSAPGDEGTGAKQGAIAGGIVGAAAPVAAAGLGSAKNAVAPRIEGATLELAQRARDLGIPLRLDQIAPTRARNTVQKISQEIPFSGVDEFEHTQKQAFTKAVAKTIGQDANDLGPDTIKSFLKDAGNKFSSAIGDQEIKFTPKDLNQFGDIVENSKGKITNDLVSIVKKNVDDFMKNSEFKFGQGRTIPAEKLASLRSQILNDLPSIQGDARQHVAKIIDAIDSVVEKQISPESAAKLSQARLEWRNFKTIEPLLEKSTDGTINPAELLNRVKATPYIKASRSTVGQDDLVDLARIGKQFLPKKGGSDTFQKSVAAGGAGGLALTALSNPLLALTVGAKAAAGVAANRALQAGNSSQKLVDLAIKSSGKAAKQLKSPLSALTLGNAGGGVAGSIQNRK